MEYVRAAGLGLLIAVTAVVVVFVVVEIIGGVGMCRMYGC